MIVVVLDTNVLASGFVRSNPTGGTLIDWEGGAGAFLYALALRQGDAQPGRGRILRDRWETIQFSRV